MLIAENIISFVQVYGTILNNDQLTDGLLRGL